MRRDLDRAEGIWIKIAVCHAKEHRCTLLNLIDISDLLICTLYSIVHCHPLPVLLVPALYTIRHGSACYGTESKNLTLTGESSSCHSTVLPFALEAIVIDVDVALKLFTALHASLYSFTHCAVHLFFQRTTPAHSAGSNNTPSIPLSL
jgi:hypothetical protein